MRKPQLDYQITTGGVSLSDNPYQRFFIATSRRLYSELIGKLLRNDIQILHVPDYISEETRQRLLGCVEKGERHDYLNDVIDPETGEVKKIPFGVWRIGPALNTVFGAITPQEKQYRLAEYWKQAVDAGWDIEEALEGHESPIDQLKADVHAAGFHVKTPMIDGLPAMSGIIRGTEAGYTPMVEQPHVDVLRDTTHFNIERQLSAIVSLEAPEEGGELLVWNGPLFDPQSGTSESGFIRKTTQKYVAAMVKPTPRSVTLFNVRHSHATTEFSRNDHPRIAMQTFLGKQGNDMYFWN